MAGERARDLERLITFVDAIVAIAVTLLVLPLADLAGQLRDGQSVATLLHDHRNELTSFFISFAVITRLWLAQHQLLRHVNQLRRWATVALLLWTLTIVFLPFPTALLGPAGEQVVTKLLYIGSLAVGTACLVVVAYSVNRHPEDASAAPRVAHAVSTLVVLLVALGLALAVPVLSYFPLVLLTVDDRLVRVWDHWTARRRAGRTD